METDFIPPQFMTRDELAKMLKLSPVTVYRLVDKRLLPFYKVGGSLRFLVKDVIAYMETCRIKPVNEAYEHTKKKQ